MQTVNFDSELRMNLLNSLIPSLEKYYADTKALQVSNNWNIREIKNYAQTFKFDNQNPDNEVIDHVLKGLTEYAVHTPHPNYFGLFNPRANYASIIADFITATFNPQLAAWSHAPFANEIENYVIQEFGKKFGYQTHSIDGTFCTGGAESNLTALICALNSRFPSFNETGIKGIDQQLVIYCSSESHHSIVKAARITGLGDVAVRSIQINDKLQIGLAALKKQIDIDREKKYLPLMVIGTAGTTGAGAIDNLNELGSIAMEENIWFHVDAAYGGAAVISKKYQHCLLGIGFSDSITLDLHKWFSVPMGASLFLTNNKKILHQSFSIQTNYMPEDGDPDKIVDPYIHSVQWSRRFIGLKIYMPLAIHGWQGYEQIIDNQIQLGLNFKISLINKGWEILNDSPLPIICFTRNDFKSGKGITQLVNYINNSGKAWVSEYSIHGQPAVRVCLTNYASGVKELDELMEVLEKYYDE